ncbi:MAG: protein kinase [Planctomycetes bacterium]|nr:protein kinase [Planctomycetota bacterium]
MREGLQRTVASEGFATAHAPVVPAPPPSATEDGRFTLHAASLTHRLSEQAAAAYPGPVERFEMLQLLGDGANGRVYAVRDRDLDREVAVKFLKADAPVPREEIDSFIAEARTTAALEHPNVLPVHEIDVNDGGQVYFSMKRIAGRSLGDAISASTDAQRADALTGPNRIVSVFIGVAHALSYAHHRRIVHQDVKPDNIMLGEFGEVLLVDWGSASRMDDPSPRLYGTPLYMSPEQARLERADARSDVYCVGASLFHALTLRQPTWADEVDAFWQKKKSGVIDPVSRSELRVSPAALIAIAVKAMAPLPQDRYARMEDLVRDLERYQAGLAVSAHRDSPWAILRRWHRRHARAIWSVAAAASVIVCLGAMLYGERLKQMATWGEPEVVERFADDAWRQRWIIPSGRFALKDGGIQSTGLLDCTLAFPTRLSGDVAVEFTGSVLTGARPCDLSLFWDRQVDPHENKAIGNSRTGGYMAQVGGRSNTFTGIRAVDGATLAISPFTLEVGREYVVRMEVIANQIRLLVDGRELCSYTDPFPLTGGWVTLYTFGAGKRISGIRIHRRSLPEQVPVTAIADASVRRGQFADAREVYDEIGQSNPHSEVGREAMYKAGLCCVRLGDEDGARSRWAPLAGSDWGERAKLHDIDVAVAAQDHPSVTDRIRSSVRSRVADVRAHAVGKWSEAVNAIATAVSEGRQDASDLPSYLSVYDQEFPDDPAAVQSAFNALVAIGRPDLALEKAGSQAYLAVKALGLLGRDDEAISRFGRNELTDPSYITSGRFQETNATSPTHHRYVELLVERGLFAKCERLDDPSSLLVTGRLQRLIESGDPNTGRFVVACAWMGRLDLVPATMQDSAEYLLATGDWRRALERGGKRMNWCMLVRHCAGLETFIAGDVGGAMDLFAVPRGREFCQRRFEFAHYAMVPFLRELAGDVGALDRSCREVEARERWTYMQRPWHIARWLLHHESDDEFLAQPALGYGAAELELLRGIDAERRGDRATAAAAYRRYLALPPWQRSSTVDPTPGRFAAWRADICYTAPADH